MKYVFMKCPFCDSEIKDDATICRFCKESMVVSQKPKSKIKRTAFVLSIVLGLVIIGIGGLIMYNRHQQGALKQAAAESTKQSSVVADQTDKDTDKSKLDTLEAMVVKVMCPIVGPGDENTPFNELPMQMGSGVMFTSEGVVITNSHVIPQYKNQYCFVVFPEAITGRAKETYLADAYVFKDISEYYDLAFLAITAPITENIQFPKVFPSIMDKDIELCFEKDIRLGDPVKVIGYPSITGGLSLTMTDGIVSSMPMEGFIYTSAKINEGNSGGMALGKNDCFIGIPAMANIGEIESMGVIISNATISEFLVEFGNLTKTDENIENSLIENEPVKKASIEITTNLDFISRENDLSMHINGNTSDNCSKVVVTYQNTGKNVLDNYQLKKYKYGDTTFRYGIREDWGNIDLGDNDYTFTAFCDGDQVVSTSAYLTNNIDLQSILESYKTISSRLRYALSVLIAPEDCIAANYATNDVESVFKALESAIKEVDANSIISKHYFQYVRTDLAQIKAGVSKFRDLCKTYGYDI